MSGARFLHRAAHAQVALSLLLCACSPARLEEHGVARERVAFESEPWNTAGPALAAPAGAPSFGTSVALDGDTLLAGAPDLDDSAPGRAYVFRAVDGAWPQTAATLSSPDGQPRFGATVALSGDTAVIAAPSSADAAGVVYVFERDQDVWSDPISVRASPPVAGDGFGRALALDGDTLFIGADADEGGAGAVYRVTRGNGAWTTEEKLRPWDAEQELAAFGAAVDVEGDRAVVGAVGIGDAPGALFLLARDGDDWNEDQVLRGSAARDGFGTAVALAGSTVAAGRSDARQAGLYAVGAVDVFRREPNGWAGLATLEPPEPIQDFFFGGDVALDGDVLGVSAPAQDEGRLYLYRLNTAPPFARQEFRPSDLEERSDLFAASLAISGQTVAAGTPNSGARDRVHLLGLVNGLPCGSALDCVSGFCSEGVCCDQRCDGGCDSCLADRTGSRPDGTCAPVAEGTDPRDHCADLPTSSCQTTGVCDGRGECERYTEGTPCAEGTCVDGREQPAGHCSAGGRCESPEARSCGGFRCGEDSCKASCASAADCNQEEGFTCLDGDCKKPLGAACTEPEACASGVCADGVCCDAHCGGECTACLAALKGGGKDGVCGSVAGGTDPDGECEADTAASCGADGLCDGFGHCRSVSPVTRSCGDLDCDLPEISAHCDGEGTCVCPERYCNADETAVMQSDHVVERCDEYQCRDGRCLESCESVYDCTGAYLCNQATGRCELDEPGAVVTINCTVASGGKRSAPPLAWLAVALLGLGRRIRRPAHGSRENVWRS